MSDFTSIDDAITFLKANLYVNTVKAGFPDVAKYLGTSGDERALEPLLEALQHGGSFMRATAASGLGFLGRREAVPYLTKAFAYDPGLYVRCDAALALGRLNSIESLPILVDSFPVEQFEVQKRIVMSITKMKDVRAKEALTALTNVLENSKGSSMEKQLLIALIQAGASD